MKLLVLLSLSLNVVLLGGVARFVVHAYGNGSGPVAHPTGSEWEATPAVSPEYRRAVSVHALAPVEEGDIVFVGDSHIAACPWADWFGSTAVRNRGIVGDGVFGLTKRRGTILTASPAQLYILTGVNDLWAGLPLDAVMAEYGQLLQAIHEESPATRVFLLSTPPMARNHIDHGIGNERARRLNDAIRTLASEHDAVYVDFVETMTRWDGTLDGRYTYDGGHLNGQGCAAAARAVAPYVEPALRRAE